MSVKQATVTKSTTIRFHESHKMPPILDPGHVTPAVVMEFQEYTTAFFIKTKTPDNELLESIDKVKRLYFSQARLLIKVDT